MSFSRRFVASAISLLGWTGLCGAQPAVQPAEVVRNWTAPPFWMRQKTEGVEPQAVDAVPTSALAFTGITPCRIVDTRGNGFAGAYGPPALAAGTPRNFTLTGQCGIPSSAQAISLNITVTNTQGPGFILIYPQGGAQPGVSTLNYVGGQTIANAAVVPLGTGGGVTIIAGVSGADLIVDTNGYYAPAGWLLTGNAGTTPATNFVGTIDDQPLEFRVDGERALRIEPLPFANTWGPNIIGGFQANSVTAGKVGAFIGGGGQNGFTNRVTGDFGTIGGGWNNEVSGYDAAIQGGADNLASGGYATLGGGRGNTAGGDYAMVPGGFANATSGDYSFAAGRRAKASHAGTFVWGDSTNADVASTGANQFIARATGGFAFLPAPGVVCGLTDATGWHCASISDRNVKKNVTSVDQRATLDRLAAMPIHLWSYMDQDVAIRHIGPMAQDFAAAFRVGDNDRMINPLDANGVALAAIQGLYELVQEKNAKIEALEARLAKLESKNR